MDSGSEHFDAICSRSLLKNALAHQDQQPLPLVHAIDQGPKSSLANISYLICIIVYIIVTYEPRIRP